MKARLDTTPTKANRPPAAIPAPRPARATAQRPLLPQAGRRDAPKSRSEMVAEAAYFRAERRGFAPGDEWRDWFDAERELGTPRAD